MTNEELIKRIYEGSVSEIEDFLGCPASMEILENIEYFWEAAKQMPNEKLEIYKSFYEQKEEAKNHYDFGKYDIPQVLKQISVNISKRFTINGVCDPVYICNSIALSTKNGDGQGYFYDTDCSSFTEEQAYKAAKDIQNSYGCNILGPEIDELSDIIRNNGEMPVKNIRQGLIKYINRCNEERLHCDYWRRDCLLGSIREAQNTLEEIKNFSDEGKILYCEDLSADNGKGGVFTVLEMNYTRTDRHETEEHEMDI